MNRRIIAFTSEVRYARDEEGRWMVEAASTPATEQCNSWLDETDNIPVDVDVAFSIKDSLDNQHSVRYMHIVLTYMSREDWVVTEVVMHRMALAMKGFSEVTPAKLKDLVEATLAELSGKKLTTAEPKEADEPAEEQKESDATEQPEEGTVSAEELQEKLKGKGK